MGLIVECGVPFERSQRYFEVLRYGFGLRPEHIPPPLSGAEAEPLGVLTAQRDDDCPDVALVAVQRVGHLAQLYRDSVIGEQPMGTKSLRPRPSGDVVGVGLGPHRRRSIVLQCACDHFRSVAHGRGALVVLVLQHLSGVREVPKDFSDEILLFPGGGSQLEGLVDLVHPLTGGDIFCVTANVLSGIGLQIFELGDQAGHRNPPFTS